MTGDAEGRAAPRATAVVLAWQWGPELVEALEALASQTTRDFEVLVIDNGGGFERDLRRRDGLPPHRYVRLPRNAGASAGRNAALRHARGDVLVFLDDDSTAEPGVLAAHLAAYEDPRIVATRGTARPKSSGLLSRVGFNYDLGAEPAAAFLNAENNCSVRRDAFASVGGFAEHLFGHEGNELSLRLIDRYGEGCIRYVPEAVVFHDDYHSLRHYLTKNFRMGRMAARIDLARVRRLRPPAVPRPSDPMTWPLRLSGKMLEISGYGYERLAGRRRSSRPGQSGPE